MIEYLIEYVTKLVNVNLLLLGFSEKVVDALVRGSLFIVVLCLSWFANKIAQGPLNRSLERLSSITSLQWDNVLVEKHVFQRSFNRYLEKRIFCHFKAHIKHYDDQNVTKS